MVKARALYLEEVLDMASLKDNPLYPKKHISIAKRTKGYAVNSKEGNALQNVLHCED